MLKALEQCLNSEKLLVPGLLGYLSTLLGGRNLPGWPFQRPRCDNNFIFVMLNGKAKTGGDRPGTVVHFSLCLAQKTVPFHNRHRVVGIACRVETVCSNVACPCLSNCLEDDVALGWGQLDR